MVREKVMSSLSGHLGEVWEDLARESVPFLGVGGETWGAAARWWGGDRHGRAMEIDVVAESLDGKALLVGESKWTVRSREAEGIAERLSERGRQLMGGRERRLITALWTRERVPSRGTLHVITPEEVMRCLKD